MVCRYWPCISLCSVCSGYFSLFFAGDGYFFVLCMVVIPLCSVTGGLFGVFIFASFCSVCSGCFSSFYGWLLFLIIL